MYSTFLLYQVGVVAEDRIHTRLMQLMGLCGLVDGENHAVKPCLFKLCYLLGVKEVDLKVQARCV